jgi:hydroxymethylbilane synthase
VDTRLRKALAGQYDAILLAGAGLVRLGLKGHVGEWLPLDTMLPAPGQGALAVQCRASDQTTLELLAALEDPSTRRAVTAERAFLSGLGGGCSLPVAAYGIPVDGSAELRLRGLVASTDGKQVIEATLLGDDPGELGGRLARYAMLRGAGEMLVRETVQ